MMKTFRKTMLLLVAATTLFAMGCTKPDSPNDGGNGGGNQSGVDTINNGGGSGGGSYYEEHEYVDLGLPSGTLWATCNVGASIPCELGYEFRWGEAKDMFTADYKYCVGGDLHQLTKYCQLPDFGYNGYIDKFMVLQSEDDAATVNWGNDWHTPTIEEWKELVDYAESFEYVDDNHYIITGPNGNTLYLPDILYDNSYCYMSNSLNPVYPTQAVGIDLEWYGGYNWSELHFIKRERTEGMYVRPVKSVGSGNNSNTIGEGGIGTINNHEYVDLGLPSGKLWATCNIGASSSEENGSYFAWAETEPKACYDWSNYKYSRNASANGWPFNLTKYCNFCEFGYNDFTDSRTTLEPSDDAAVVNWGGGWHVPSTEDWEELIRCCFHGKSIYRGIEGYMFVSRNSHFLFLPLSGYSVVHQYGSSYWCNRFFSDYQPYRALVFSGKDADDWDDYEWDPDYWGWVEHRCWGLPIRPIYTP